MIRKSKQHSEQNKKAKSALFRDTSPPPPWNLHRATRPTTLQAMRLPTTDAT